MHDPRDIITLDFETRPIQQRPVYPPAVAGLAIKHGLSPSVYMSCGHASGINTHTWEDIRYVLREAWDSGRPLLFHNAKFDLSVCVEGFGLPMPDWRRVHDTMFLIFLADPHCPKAGLKEVSAHMLGWPPEEQDAVGDWAWEHRKQIHIEHGLNVTRSKGKVSKVWQYYWIAPPEIAGPYACGDTDRTMGLYQKLMPFIERRNMTAAYDRERQVMPIFYQNEREGMRVDLARLEEDVSVFENYIEYVDDRLRDRLGDSTINFDNDAQVAAALSRAGIVRDEDWSFTKTGVKWAKKNPGEKVPEKYRSVSKDALPVTAYQDRMVASAFGYRNRLSTCTKMFMRPWRDQARVNNGWITTNWNQTRGADGGTRCMPAGQLVLTDRGYIPVESVCVGDKVLSHTGQPRAVLDAFINGVKPVYRTTTTCGMTLYTTGNHEFYTSSGWMRADELTPGADACVLGYPEYFVPVPGWPYQISSWGRVYSDASAKFLAQQKKGKWGHLKVALKRNGARKRGPDFKDFPVHRLVSAAFCTGAGPEVLHKNGVAWVNVADNLTVGTSSENTQQALAHGTGWVRHSGKTKLTEEAVSEIRSTPRATRSGGVTNEMLAKKFGVNPRLIRAVRAGHRWKDAPEKNHPNIFRTAVVERVEFMRECQTYGLTVEEDHSHVTGGFVTHNTGRPSTAAPNFLNISKTFTGRPDGYVHPEFLGVPELPLVREYILADDDESLFLHRDFSGQELRVFAHYESGPVAAAYRANPALDVHQMVADNIQRIAPGTELDRTKTKIMNFRTMYGSGVRGIAGPQGLNCDYAKAREFKQYHDMALPGRAVLVDEIKALVRQGKPIRTWGGREYSPEPPYWDDEEGSWRDFEYKLINYLIQGSAADITKQCMIDWHNHPDREGRFMVQVYDEMNINAHRSVAVKANAVLKEVMEYNRLDVPMLSDGKYGRGWGFLTKGELTEEALRTC